jgi:hypothetical protein
MQLLDGVPLLHTACLDSLVKSELMHALVLSLGVQVSSHGLPRHSYLMRAGCIYACAPVGLQMLCGGLFHTDPHPGNLMACKSPDGAQYCVGLLDFGQVMV